MTEEILVTFDNEEASGDLSDQILEEDGPIREVDGKPRVQNFIYL